MVYGWSIFRELMNPGIIITQIEFVYRKNLFDMGKPYAIANIRELIIK